MADYIDDFGGPHVNLLKNQAKLIRLKLRMGPVVLGERHDKAAARAVVADLIIEKVVNQLFVEIGDLGPMADDELLYVLRFLDRKHDNPISFETLLTIAAFNKVLVVGYDNPSNDDGIFRPASTGGMANRNIEMGQKLVAQGGAGSIAIVGSFHLYPKHSGGPFSTTLQHQGGVPFSHAIDLSKY